MIHLHAVRRPAPGPSAPAPVRGPSSLTLLAFAFLSFALSGCKREAAPDPVPHTNAAPTVRGAALVPLTNMVRIKGGSFQRQQRTVTLTYHFWMGKFEVTQGEYAAFMGTNPSYFQEAGTNCPVEKVTHVEAMKFCLALSQREREAGRLTAPYEYRLPTEAEWEYACRAGTTNRFSFGDSVQDADAYAWTTANSDGHPHPVGLKRPNLWGLHDMHGNVWEWCQDWFALYPPADVRNPVGPPEGKFKVFRGGGWNHDPDFAGAAHRFMMPPSNGIHYVGFRLVLGPRIVQQSPH